METMRDNWPREKQQAVKSYRVLVVGAGIGGLTTAIALAQTGHTVQILESASVLEEVGAGIQIAPNASRILHRLGVLQAVMRYITVLERVSVRRYDSDEELATFPVMPINGLKYGAPMGVIHRADLQRVLLRRATELGCEVLTNHNVIEVDEDFSARVKVVLGAGQETFWLTADLLVGADGIHSTVRQQLMERSGHFVETVRTGDAAYRLLIPIEAVTSDLALLSMVKQNIAIRYMGPGGHIMAYPVRNNTLYNLVLLHTSKPNVAGSNPWTTKASRTDMMNFFSGWSPMIRRWLRYANEEVLEWDLHSYSNLPTWTTGSTVLLGDACHPMLPYVAQGAANAIEDAAVLSTALTCTSDIQLALRMYESVRKARAEKIALSASATANALHLPDGPEQRKRDETMKNPRKAASNPDKWNNEQWQQYMWGVDVMAETLKLWKTICRISLTRRERGLRKAYSYMLSMNLAATMLREHLCNLAISKPRTLFSKRMKHRKSAFGSQTQLPTTWNISSWRSQPVAHGCIKLAKADLQSALGQLRRLPPLVHPQEIQALRRLLRNVATGNAFVLQAGHFADMFAGQQLEMIESGRQLVNELRCILAWGTGKTVLCVARVGGDYEEPGAASLKVSGKAKPRRNDGLNGVEVKRGIIPANRLLQSYFHSAATLNYLQAIERSYLAIDQQLAASDLDSYTELLSPQLSSILKNVRRSQEFCRARGFSKPSPAISHIYASHEGSVLEYEAALTKYQAIRPTEVDFQSHQLDPKHYDTSSHLLCIGDRAHTPTHAQIEFFRGIENPIGVRIGRNASVKDIICLLKTLNPAREAGKVSLITSFGASRVSSILPKLIRAVEDSEYRSTVVWQCDPVRSNSTCTTIERGSGKIDDIWAELRITMQLHRAEGSYLGGLQLEVAPRSMAECTEGRPTLMRDDMKHCSSCRSRLNSIQSRELALLFAEEMARLRG
ncbi:hypothetical protein NLG97_g4983 [Lecanicillium saksenae]|uniref:Uncharacterized protein n=1 Tax=Lecanicillium saksenae TaxID=468837 RepID=A0ACC1QTS7_9HYPO|nr:hypothetical protein NLG97_g4983 [Lecanicillium saksenae]